MAMRKHPDKKVAELKQHGSLNPCPDTVRDELFQQGGFFDSRDMVQVKYEMLRRVQAEGRPVTEVAAMFGLSRPTFYKADEAYKRAGLPGLLPARPGPKGAHKLTAKLMSFIDESLAADRALGARALARMIRRRFRMKIHPRSIERALARRKKGRQ